MYTCLNQSGVVLKVRVNKIVIIKKYIYMIKLKHFLLPCIILVCGNVLAQDKLYISKDYPSDSSYRSGSADVDIIKLTTQHWSPYQMLESGKLTGIAIDIVKCSFDKLNKSYEIEFLPWRRAQIMVGTGVADGFFAASANEKRSEYAVFSEKIIDQNWNWYLLKDSEFSPDDPNFKKDAKVASEFATNMNRWLNKNDYNVISSPFDPQSLVKEVFEKKVDAILSNELVATHAMKSLGISLDRFKVYTIKTIPLGVYWSKKFLEKHPEFLNRFNSALKQCRHVNGQH